MGRNNEAERQEERQAMGKLRVLSCAIVMFASAAVMGEEPADIRELKLKEWQPRSMMVTKTTIVETPQFPVIDIHNHLGGGKETLTKERVARYLEEMDAAGVQTVVNLDGGWDERLVETIAALDQAHPGRFVTFTLVNFAGFDDAGWGEREANRLEKSFAAGAKGLKFHKTFGLTHRDKNGALIRVDDPKLDGIWQTCAKHGRPVIIHTADPAAFFTPLDKFNERWHELNEHPDWLFFGAQFPRREELLEQLERVFAKHPETKFVSTHFGNNAEDLEGVSRVLEKYPNVSVDIDARISELGRQPYSARRFMIKYQDRVMFGTDTRPKREAFRIYFRFLETDDEYFDCAESHHRQGFWNIYGLSLPAEVLEKIYFRNAERLLGMDGLVSAGLKKTAGRPTMHVKRTEDFEVTGTGENPAWKGTEWTMLNRRGEKGKEYDCRVKLLYSKKGLYVLMRGSDGALSAKMTEDYSDLWTEDVFEVFLWPNEGEQIYFEYEISPLNVELPIIVPNLKGKAYGWRPWHYEGERKIKKGTSVKGGEKKPGAKIEEWTAEIFVPYALLEPMQNISPEPGTRWRANFYRNDFDGGTQTAWDWSRVGPSYHEFEKFGTLIFD